MPMTGWTVKATSPRWRGSHSAIARNAWTSATGSESGMNLRRDRTCYRGYTTGAMQVSESIERLTASSTKMLAQAHEVGKH